MINDWIGRLSPWLFGLVALSFGLTAWAAIRAFHTMRTGLYYVVREEARKRGLRLAAAAAFILLVGVILAVVIQVIRRPPPVATPVALGTPTTAAPTPTGTSSPTASATPTPSPLPSPTPLTPTATPTPTLIPPDKLPPSLRTFTPPPPAVTAVPGAQFGPLTFAAGAPDAKCAPSPPRTGQVEFEAGVPKICAYFSVRNMARNTVWTAAWYRGGEYIAGDPLLWDGPASGVGIAFYTEPGRRPGGWELRLYIENRLQSTGVFTVSRPTASPTPTP